ncbi:MAG: glycosyltransferase family 4 protein [Gammaproteobacteria bacterium]
MRIAIVTDAWQPQVNGVVTTLSNTIGCLAASGHQISLITPQSFRTIPAPTYPSIRLAVRPRSRVTRMLDGIAPDAIHIATEGPLGVAARRYCQQTGFRFTTSYHTRFPEYIRMRLPIPVTVSYAWLRGFHAAAARTLVSTESQRRELAARGFRHLVIWPRGVDTGLFRPQDKTAISAPRPILLYAGRVAAEKNIEAFLRLDLPGTKVVVGDGPALPRLRRDFPHVHFAGYKHGQALAAQLAAADVFVFPSRSDTFGLVMLEAMACGVPVAAYPVPGPVDVVVNGVSGVLDHDLKTAVTAALRLDPASARAQALKHSWQAATERFVDHLFCGGAFANEPVGRIALR